MTAVAAVEECYTTIQAIAEDLIDMVEIAAGVVATAVQSWKFRSSETRSQHARRSQEGA